MCREICVQYRLKRQFGKSPFESGGKYCKRCGLPNEEGIYIKWDGKWCPCCGFKLRTKARHKHKDPEHKCVQCSTFVSIRGEIPLWFKDNVGNDVCWKCWFKIHKVQCVDCGIEGKVIVGKRDFVIKSIFEIRCKICHKIYYYQKMKQRRQKKQKKPILPRFH